MIIDTEKNNLIIDAVISGGMLHITLSVEDDDDGQKLFSVMSISGIPRELLSKDQEVEFHGLPEMVVQVVPDLINPEQEQSDG